VVRLPVDKLLIFHRSPGGAGYHKTIVD
jgi:hypothetical protein